MNKCEDGVSFAFWMNISSLTINPPFTGTDSIQIVFSVPSSFFVYIINMELYIDIYQNISRKVSIEKMVNKWVNLAFSWNKRTSTLAIYINGDSINAEQVTSALGDIEEFNTVTGIGTFGAIHTNYPTPQGMMVRDFIIWNRALFPVEANKFIGIGGTSRFANFCNGCFCHVCFAFCIIFFNEN